MVLSKSLYVLLEYGFKLMNDNCIKRTEVKIKAVVGNLELSTFGLDNIHKPTREITIK